MMRRRMTRSGATNDLPTSINVLGTAATPSQVLMQIGNTDIRKMIATLTAKPKPNHSHQRHRKAGGDVNSDRRLQHPEAADDEAERYADRDGERKARRKRPQ